MTSRARRIVLALYGHRQPTIENRIVSASCPTVAGLTMTDSSVYWMGTHGCYEATYDVDEHGPLERAVIASPIAPRVLVGGNYGLPCA